MRRKNQLIPTPIDLLESRIVPSHGASGALVRQDQALVVQINEEFDVFRNDYDQARATYFTSIQNQPAPSPATTYAFAAYTTQRVSLLAQQTLNLLSQTKHSPAATRALKRAVATKIMGPRAQTPPGSLAQALIASIPQPGTTAPTSSLYSLGQDSAIESARVALVNGVEGL